MSEIIVHQGDVFWYGDAIRHPHVIVQDDLFNHSRIHTTIVCSLTSNLKRVSYPGNLLLNADEANLPQQSVVEVSKIASVEKVHLGEYIGSLSEQRINQILAGLRFLSTTFGR